MRNSSTNQKTHSDPETEAAFDAYIETVCKEHEKGYHSDLQPFSVERQKIQLKLRDALNEYQTSYANGYKALIEVLKNDPSVSLSDFDVDEEHLALFSDPEKLQSALNEGKSIYELLGFSEKTLTQFYEKASELLQKEQPEKAKDAFYFLTALAPQSSLFWYCLGYCYNVLQNLDAAGESFDQAIYLDPTNQDNYLAAIRTALAKGDIDRAAKLCDIGITFVTDNSQEAWSQPLLTSLTEEKSTLNEGRSL